MSPDCVRRHRAVDIVQLGCVATLAVVTWAAIPHASGDVAWKHCLIVTVTTLLALAAVTPHDSRAVSMRLVMSGWLAVAPCLAAFGGMPAARWAYWIASSLIAVSSALDVLPRRLIGRSKLAQLDAPNGATISPAPSAIGAWH
jgi:hypothetical protein